MMKTKFNGTIRKAIPQDLELLIELGKQSFYEAFNEVTAPDDMEEYLTNTFQKTQIKEQLKDEQALIFIAEIGSDPAGYVYFHPATAPGCLENKAAIKLERIYLRRQYYGWGVGDALMQTCIEQARSLGFESIWLSSWELNDRANAFYKKWGFIVAGNQKFTVGSDIQNDYILSRKL